MGVLVSSKKNYLPRSEISELLEVTAFTKREIEDYYESFQLDYPEGYLTVENFQMVYINMFPQGNTSVFAENMFRVFDQNNDKRINFREFIIALSISTRGSLEDKARWMFQLYDANNNGYISKDEMLLIVTAIYQMKSMKNIDSVAEKRVEKIYEDMDTNKDGQLSFDEFLVLAKADPVVLDILSN